MGGSYYGLGLGQARLNVLTMIFLIWIPGYNTKQSKRATTGTDSCIFTSQSFVGEAKNMRQPKYSWGRLRQKVQIRRIQYNLASKLVEVSAVDKPHRFYDRL